MGKTFKAFSGTTEWGGVLDSVLLSWKEHRGCKRSAPLPKICATLTISCGRNQEGAHCPDEIARAETSGSEYFRLLALAGPSVTLRLPHLRGPRQTPTSKAINEKRQQGPHILVGQMSPRTALPHWSTTVPYHQHLTRPQVSLATPTSLVPLASSLVEETSCASIDQAVPSE